MVVSSQAKWFYTAEKEKGRRQEKQVSCWHGLMGIQHNSIHCSDPDRTESKPRNAWHYYIILYYIILLKVTTSFFLFKQLKLCCCIWASVHLHRYIYNMFVILWCYTHAENFWDYYITGHWESENDKMLRDKHLIFSVFSETFDFFTVMYCSDVSSTWWCWWTADRRPSTVYLSHTLLSFNPIPSHSHSLPPWLITSFVLSLLLSFLNIMCDWVKCYGKLRKIKTREQLYSPMSCVIFIAQLLTETCLRCPWRWVLMTECRPWKEWECCIE